MGHTTVRTGHLERSSHPAAEAAVLLAIATCPVLVVPLASHPFEPHKAAFLWMTAGAGCAAVSCAPRTSWQRLRGLGAGQRLFLLGLACAVAGLCLAATFSEAPHLAWWGSALRRDGAMTQVALLAVLAVTMLITSSISTADRLVNAAILGSVGPTVYALAQALHVDPLTWDLGRSQGNSTFGNWLFFAGYLATVWPLTLGRAVLATRRASTAAWSFTRTGCAGAAWTLLGLQSMALVLAGSRGPLLALAATGGVAGLVALGLHGRRLIALLAAAAAFVVVVILLVLAPPRLAAAAARGLDASAMSNAERSVVVRLILWDAVGTGLRSRIASDLGTALVGTGPESTTRLVTRHARPGLGDLLASSDIVPDRAHNDTLEALATTGVAGLLLRVVLLGTVIVVVLVGLGLLERSQVRAFASCGAAMLCGAAALAIWRGGGLGSLALVVPASVVLSVAGWIVRHQGTLLPRDREGSVYIVAAAAAALVHLFDMQSSVATVGSSLTAVVATGIALGLTPAAAGGSSPGLASEPRAGLPGPSLTVATLAGWTAAVLTIALEGPGVPQDRLSAVLIAACAWTLSLAAIGADGRGVAASAATWAAACAGWWLWPASTDVAARLPLFYGLGFACVVAVILGLGTGESRRRRMGALTAALAAGGLIGIVAVRTTAADVYEHAAMVCSNRGDFDCAAAQFRNALARSPMNDQLLTEWAQMLMARSGTLTGAAADAALADAGGALRRAQEVDPFSYQHPRNVAALERRRARRGAADERTARLDDAERHYRRASDLAPSNGALWAEWANLDAERGRTEAALAKLDRAASLGSAREVGLLADLLLGVTNDAAASGAHLARIAADVRGRGYEQLAGLYARRAAEAARGSR